MAFRDCLIAPEEGSPGHCDESRSPASNAFLPYLRNDSSRRRPIGGARPGSAVGSEPNLDRPLAVELPKFDKLRRAGTPDAAPTTRRRLLWEIWDGYHCSICGTCLSFAELGRIADKAGIRFESDESEHGIHGHFVQIAAKPGRVAKLTQKILDRKYRNAIERFRRAKSETQVAELWNRALSEGDVPGPYWALMTHPRCTPALMMQAFGEVHMLSHLAGATNRADIRRLRLLEGERRDLTGQLTDAMRRLTESEARNRRLAADHEEVKRELANRLRAGRAVDERMGRLEGRLRELEDDETVRTLRVRNAALESELEEARRRLRTETQRRSTLEHDLSALQASHQEVSATVRALSTECDALESMLESGIDGANGGGVQDGRAVDLCGRRVAYVGGRSRNRRTFSGTRGAAERPLHSPRRRHRGS